MVGRRHGGRGSHSSTSQLNLSRFRHRNSLKPTQRSLQKCSRQAEKCMSVSPCMAAYVASVKAKEPPHSLRYIGSMVGAYTRPLLTST